MEELVRYIASTLVDHPEQVQVKTVDNPESVIIELSVGPDDMGKVIGKQANRWTTPFQKTGQLFGGCRFLHICMI